MIFLWESQAVLTSLPSEHGFRIRIRWQDTPILCDPDSLLFYPDAALHFYYSLQTNSASSPTRKHSEASSFQNESHELFHARKILCTQCYYHRGQYEWDCYRIWGSQKKNVTSPMWAHLPCHLCYLAPLPPFWRMVYMPGWSIQRLLSTPCLFFFYVVIMNAYF